MNYSTSLPHTPRYLVDTSGTCSLIGTYCHNANPPIGFIIFMAFSQERFRNLYRRSKIQYVYGVDWELGISPRDLAVLTPVVRCVHCIIVIAAIMPSTPPLRLPMKS